MKRTWDLLGPEGVVFIFVQLFLIIAKFSGFKSWSWWAITAPTWGGAILILVACIVMSVWLVLADRRGRRRADRRLQEWCYLHDATKNRPRNIAEYRARDVPPEVVEDYAKKDTAMCRELYEFPVPVDRKDLRKRAAPDQFVQYVRDNYPPNTIISDPVWHAPKLWHAAMEALVEVL